MKHFVFCAATHNKEAIQAAKYAKNALELEWMLNYDCVGEVHSKFGIIEKENTEIYLEGDNITTLIDDCMAFAYRYTKIKETIN